MLQHITCVHQGAAAAVQQQAIAMANIHQLVNRPMLRGMQAATPGIAATAS
jgi:hypothetical protein